MAACRLHDEDQVCVAADDKGFVYGLVLENSEYVSSDEENDAVPGQLRRGTVRVAWHPNGAETVVAEDKVILADRSLMPGDVVRRLIKDKDSQRGFVMDMQVTCHVQILGSDKYIYNIDSQDILPSQMFDPDPGEVTMDSWVGRIEGVTEEITIRFTDGAVCKVPDTDLSSFMDAGDKRGKHTEFSLCFFYPGQLLRGTMGDLESANWQHVTLLHNNNTIKSKPKTHIYVVVQEVATKTVDVHWLCHGFTGFKNSVGKLDPPPRVVKGDSLKRLVLLDWFAHCSLQIGDRGFYVIKDSDKLETVPPHKVLKPDVLANQNMVDCPSLETMLAEQKDPAQSESSTNLKSTASMLEKFLANGDEDEGDDADYEDVDEPEDFDSCQSEAGSTASGRSSPVGSSQPKKKKSSTRKGGGPHVFTRAIKKLKGRKSRKKVDPPKIPVNPGDKVAVEIYYTFSRAKVMWQDGSIEENISSAELHPIHHLDELEFFPGDYVVDAKESSTTYDYGVVVTSDHSERTCIVKWYKNADMEKCFEPECVSKTEVSVYDIKDHDDYKYRPGHSVIRVGGFGNAENLEGVGMVYQLDPQGTIMVRWPSGKVSHCYPQELYIVSDELSEYESSEWDSEEEEEGSDVSWETEDEEELAGDEAEEGTDQECIMEACRKSGPELAQLLQKAKAVLSSMQEICDALEGQPCPDISSFYRDCTRIYRCCKELDRMLQSTSFADPEIADLMAAVRVEAKRERGQKLTRHVSHMMESWGQVQNKSKEMRESKSASARLCSLEAADRKNDFKEGDKCDRELSELLESISAGEGGKKEAAEVSSVVAKGGGSSEPAPVVNGASGPLEGKNGVAEEDKYDEACAGEAVTANSASLATTPDEKSAVTSPFSCSTPTTPSPDVESRTGEEEQGATAIKNCSTKDAGATVEGKGDSKMRELCVKVCMNLALRLAKITEIVNMQAKQLNPAEGGVSSTNGPLESSLAPMTPSGAEDKGLPNGDDVTAEAGKEEAAGKAEGSSVDPGDYPKSSEDLQVESKEGLKKDTWDLSEPDSKEAAILKARLEEWNLTEEDLKSSISEYQSPKGFRLCSEAPSCHKFYNKEMKTETLFMTAVKRELKLLHSSLPDGIMVKGFEDRLDLYAVMITGPAKTPYEDGVFLFDVLLPSDYPASPPSVYYLSFCSDRLNPNLYEDGKVCVSLLGTWSGKGNEVWTKNSNLLQVLVSIQGLILVGEPYYNEAGYERQRGTQQGSENSRMYNEMAILKLVQSMNRMVASLPTIFEEEVREHLVKQGPRMIARLERWLNLPSPNSQAEMGAVGGSLPAADSTANSSNGQRESSNALASADTETPTAKSSGSSTGTGNCRSQTSVEKSDSLCSLPDFPLLPASKGFRLSLRKHLVSFATALQRLKDETS